MTRVATGTSLWVEGRAADAALLTALQANYGHLSTMQVRGGTVRGLQRHVDRLQSANLELFGSPLSDARIRHSLAAALRAAGVDDATLRVSVGAPDVAAVERGDAVEVVLLVAVSPPRQPPEAPQRVGSHVHVRPLAHLKHLAMLPLLHARRVARSAGFDDALLVDAGGRVLEGALWNVGFIDADGIVWPDAEALRGITEGLLRDAVAAAGIAQSVRPVRRDAVDGFRAAFACNSSGLWPLASLDGREFAGDPSIQARLQALLDAVPWDPLAD